MQATQRAVTNNEYRNISIAALVESGTNPRKRFDPVALEELAAYVPGHIMDILCRWRFCDRGRQTAHRNWRCPRRRAHNDYKESSHFSSSSSLRRPSLRRDVIEAATGGRQAVTAAIFPLRVISA
jgi:hypothetical protein